VLQLFIRWTEDPVSEANGKTQPCCSWECGDAWEEAAYGAEEIGTPG